MKSTLIRALSLFLIIISISAATAMEIREEQVQFKTGETDATIKGRIKGRQIVDYRLSVKAGQSMAVILKPVIAPTISISRRRTRTARCSSVRHPEIASWVACRKTANIPSASI